MTKNLDDLFNDSPSKNWQVPVALPDLRCVGIVALDTETKDAGLHADRGSAWPWGDGYVCGISVAYRADGAIQSHYLPIRHPDSKNFPRENVIRWLKDLLASNVRIVTQNGLYDWGWLRADFGLRMPPSDRLEEIGALATLVDENRYAYSLDALCAWRGLPGKNETLLREGCAALGLIPKGRKKFNPQALIHKLPARYVGPYAEQDPVSTLLLYENLHPILDQEGTRDAYRLEVYLLPMVHEMRRRGIRVDTARAGQARDYCLQKRDAALAELSKQLGNPVSMAEIASPIWKARTFDAHAINYPRTEKGNPSFKAGKLGWMTAHPHWLPRLIATANKYEHAGSTFLEGHILAHLIGDRVYAEINPHRSEDGGTRSFRFSYSNPPLQQMPSRDEELGPLIRRVFLPEDDEFWAESDASQQEFRFVVHHANQHKLRKAAEAVARYLSDPNTDFHEFAAALTSLKRAAAKGVNFAYIYGAGVEKLAEMIGVSVADAKRILNQYDRQLPFLRQLSDVCERQACNPGYIVLYDGARRHFDKFAPADKWQKGAGPCSFEEARARLRDPNHPWYRRGPLYRADTHTALNALIQGSAARHTKLWMRAVWREGIVPLLQMHDALECSVSSREQAELVARLGEEAVQLDVPMRVHLKFGRSWGDANHAWEELT
jgi:DNA polymerase I-like protein with 3'-5' exonuclease and polymerase domains